VLLFSVFAALILWFYVQEAESPDYKKTFSSVSVRVEELSSSFSVIGGGEITADITLVGKRSDLNKLKASDEIKGKVFIWGAIAMMIVFVLTVNTAYLVKY